MQAAVRCVHVGRRCDCPPADTDEFGHLPIWEQQTVGRMYIYDSTMSRLPTSGTIGVNDLASASKDCGGRARVPCFDFILLR